MHRLIVVGIVFSLINTSIGTLLSQSSRVPTSSSTWIGHQAPNRSSVTEFLGIRYAEAPVGELRFAAPRKYVAPVDAIFEASEWVSLQQELLHGFTTDHGSRPTVRRTSHQSVAFPTSLSLPACIYGRTLQHRTTTRSRRIA
jgi:hypothetical protein